MKNTLFTFTFLLIGFHTSHAQLSEQKRHYISLNAGVSAPLGKYADDTYHDKEAAHAMTGMDFHLEGAYYLKPYVGIGAKAGLFSNKMNKLAYQDSMNNDLVSIGLNGTPTSTASSWQNMYIMVGPVVSLPFHKFTFDLKLMGGWLHTFSHQIDVTVKPNSSPDLMHNWREYSSGTSFSYNIGLAARYHFLNRWAVSAHVDLISAKPSIDEKNYSTYQGTTLSGELSYKQPINVLNAGIGVVFHFIR